MISVYDLLPFPNITSSDPQGQIKQLIDYLGQFKEDLEFILSDTQNSKTVSANVAEEAVQRVVSTTVDIREIVGSYAFKQAVADNIPQLYINRENGHLEGYKKGER